MNQACRDKVSLFAVVVDIMEPFQIQNLQFTTKIKIIDQNFNYDQAQTNTDVQFQRYAYVYIYSNKISGLPLIKNVGDIIRLRRFQFSVNSMGELVGVSKSFSNWLVYNLNNSEQYSFKENYIEKNQNRQLLAYEQSKFDQLRVWALNLFSNTSIKQILWWKKFPQPNDENQAKIEQKKIENVDLVLKAQDVDKKANQINFVSMNGQKFIMKLSVQPTLVENQVVKLKNVGVQYHQDGKFLVIGTNSSCLCIPKKFFDSKCFDKNFFEKNKGRFRSNSPPRGKSDGNYLTKKQVIDKYQILEDFQFEEILIGRKDLIENPHYESIGSDQLTMINKLYLQRIPVQMCKFNQIDLKFQQEALHQKFVLYGYIKKIQRPSEKNFFTYCSQCQKVEELFSQNRKKLKCCGELDIALLLEMKLTDQSLRQQEELLVQIVLRKKDLDPFKLWKVYPDINDTKMWKNFDKKTLKYFQTKAKAAENHQKKSKFVVELKKSQKNQFFLELTDTIFCPQVTYNKLQQQF